MTTALNQNLPRKRWLPRAAVIDYVGGRRELERLERTGLLRREFPAGLKRARYLRAAVVAVIEGD